MLNLLWQEILILKEYSFLIRNLSVTTVLAILITVGLGEVYLYPAKLIQQQRLESLTTMIRVGKSIKY